MDKKKLVGIIREMVRKEVRSEVSLYMDSLQEDMTKAFKQTLKEALEGVPTEDVVVERVEHREPPAPNRRSKLLWDTGNEILNNILKETTDVIPAETGLETPMMPVIPVEDPSVPDAVRKAMTRDYSELMNAIDKKRGG